MRILFAMLLAVVALSAPVYAGAESALHVVYAKARIVEAVDSDSDGLADATEAAIGTDPSVADTDGDGLLDGDEEILLNTIALREDSDGDGFGDGLEVAAGSDPLLSASFPVTVSGTIVNNAPVAGPVRATIAAAAEPQGLVTNNAAMALVCRDFAAEDCPVAFTFTNAVASGTAFRIEAWADANTNGVRDAWEPAGGFDSDGVSAQVLSGVEIRLEGGLPPEPMTVTMTGYEGVYDGAAHGVCVSVEEDVEEAEVMYAVGDVAPVPPWSDVPPTRTDAGSTTVWCAVSAPGRIPQTNSAAIAIAKRPVTLTSGSASKRYDGTPLTMRDVEVGGDGFVAGEGATFICTGSQTDVGFSENMFTYTLDDGTKADNYEIAMVYGTLEVTDADEPWGGLFPGEGSVTHPKTWRTGQKATWKAVAAKGSVFAHWEGEFVESLGLSRNMLRNPSLKFTVPEGFDPDGIRAVFVSVDDDRLSSLSLSLPGPIEVNAAVDGLELMDDSLSYVTATVGGLPSGLKYDAKNMAIVGVPTKPGAYVLKVSAKNASGYKWAENIALCVADASGEVAPVPDPGAPKRTMHYPLMVVASDADAGTVSGTGVYAEGTKVSISAKPARGCVFAGWYSGEEMAEEDEIVFASGDFRASPQTVTVPDIRYVYARFAAASEDAASLAVAVTNATAGSDGSCSLDLGACVTSLSLPKLSVSGLPSGVKYDAKTMTISGRATKPGIYTVKVSATNASVKKAVAKEFTLTVPNLSCDALPNLLPATDAYGTVVCGVTFDANLVDCTPENGWTVKVAGLPAGLKYDAKTGKITGVPTKAGTFTVTFTASKGKEKQTATITLTTEALPPWATGTFAGWVSLCNLQPPYAPLGIADGFATMTVAANGKVSGKATVCGTNWTFSAASCSSAERLCGETVAIEIATAMKSGKVEVPVVFQIEPRESPEGDGAALVNAASSVYAALDESGSAYIDGALYRNLLLDKATAAAAKAEAARMEGVYTVSLDGVGGSSGGYGGYLSLTVGKDGGVKASGKLVDGTAVSASSQLFYDAEAFGGYGAVLFASPSAYKGGCFELPVSFGTERGQIVSPWSGFWENRNPQATGDYGEWLRQRPDAVGAYYDKADKLNSHYESLRFATEAPELQYTFKETFIGESGRKTTESYIAEAYPVDTLGQSGTTVGVGEKGFVVAKATKPTQDKTTKEWSYNGANDGALSLSFAQATGIFKGSYTFWYDYMSAYDDTKPEGKQETIVHTSKKVSFEGVWVQGSESLRGFYLWDATSFYSDPKTGKPKTYKYKEPHAVNLRQ